MLQPRPIYHEVVIIKCMCMHADISMLEINIICHARPAQLQFYTTVSSLRLEAFYQMLCVLPSSAGALLDGATI